VIRVLTYEEVKRLLPMEACIDVMAEALESLARGEMFQPLRTVARPPEGPGFMGLMPAYRGGGQAVFALKAINVVPDNPAKRGLDAHQGGVLLSDGETGELRALLNASAITEIRTAAVSGVAARLLAREDSSELAILGAGVQARSHVEAMRAVRSLDRILLNSPTPGHAEELARDVGGEAVGTAEEAVSGADVIVTATTSRDPVVRREWLKAGVHINAVGSGIPTARELDTATVADAALFVDRRESTLNEAGDYLIPAAEGAIGPEHIRAELGEVLVGAAPGRTSPDELTVFKSLGIAVEDLAAAQYVLRRAEQEGIGTEVRF
jgi:ornithine cyclodeaminase